MYGVHCTYFLIFFMLLPICKEFKHYFSRGSLQTMWGNDSSSAKRAILIAEENESILGAFAMLELQTLQKENLLTRRGHSLSKPLFDLLKSIQASKPFVVLSVDKGQELTPMVLYSSDTSDIGKGIVPYYRLLHTLFILFDFH